LISRRHDDIDEPSLVAEEASLLRRGSKPVAERQRQITAKIQIPHSVEQVWQVLTAYEALATYIPNLPSRRLEHPTGGIALSKWYPTLATFQLLRACDLDLEEKFPHEIISIW